MNANDKLTTSQKLPLALSLLSGKERIERAWWNILEEFAVPALQDQYEAEIAEWDWDGLVADCADFPEDAGEEEEHRGSVFLGAVFDLAPSGKYWNILACGNVNAEEAIADTSYTEALEAVAQRHGGWIESGEGDPCDLFFGRWLTE